MIKGANTATYIRALQKISSIEGRGGGGLISDGVASYETRVVFFSADAIIFTTKETKILGLKVRNTIFSIEMRRFLSGKTYYINSVFMLAVYT